MAEVGHQRQFVLEAQVHRDVLGQSAIAQYRTTAGLARFPVDGEPAALSEKSYILTSRKTNVL
jgi:hypothetical protein